MNSEALKKLLPYIIALPIFYLASLSLFYPEMVGNKTLRQTDIVQFEAMKKFSVDYAEKYGETALWNVGMFSGFPEFLMSGFPSGGFEFLEKATAGFLNEELSAHVFFRCAFCAWILLLCFRINPYLSIIGGLAFAFNTYGIVTLEAGHFTKMWAIAYACLVVGGMKLVFDKKYLLGTAIFLAGLVMELRAAHYQITFYLAIICLVYGVAELIRLMKDGEATHFAKGAVMLLLAASLAASTQTARLWMTNSYTPYSTRGVKELPKEDSTGDTAKEGLDKDYAFSWSQGKMETFTLLVPYLYGGGSAELPKKDSEFIAAIEKLAGRQQAQQMLRANQPMVPMYHGEQPFTSGPVYAGAILCFLFVLALFVLPVQQRVWMSVAALLAMFIAWGDNLAFFNYFLFDYVPGFNKFRSPSMALSMTIMVMTVGAMLGADFLLKEKEQSAKLVSSLAKATAVTAGLCLLLALGAGMLDVSSLRDASTAQRMFGTSDTRVVNTIVNALEDDRISWARSDGFRSLVFILLAAATLFATLKDKLSVSVGIVALGLLMVADVWLVDNRYLFPDKFVSARQQRNSHQPTAADQLILRDSDPHYRVLDFNNTYNQASTSYFHKTIGGYFAAKLGRYQDLIDRQLIPEQQRFIESLRGGAPDFSELPAMNMLNAKYFKFGNSEREVIRNPLAMGNAWFVEGVQKVNSPLEEIEALNDLQVDSIAVMDQSKFTLASGSTAFEVGEEASIGLASFNNREVKYSSRNSNAGLAVFSEVYYPDWEATIDGEAVEIKRVNYVLRALEVPAGEHEIVFSFKPASYLVGAPITEYTSYAALAFVLIALLFSGYKEATA